MNNRSSFLRRLSAAGILSGILRSLLANHDPQFFTYEYDLV